MTFLRPDGDTISKTLLLMLLVLLLSLLGMATLVGCGRQPSSVETPTPTPSPTPTPTPTPTPSLPTPTQLTMLSITEGNVFVMKSGTDSWLEAQVGMTLEPGDTIKAGNNSRAVITFFEGSTIELEAGTEINVVTLDIAADTGSTAISLKQEIGKTVSRVEKLADPTSVYEVETPGAIAAVRGSIMLVYVDLQGGTTIGCEAGNVTGTTQGITVWIPVGMQRYAKLGQPFGSAVPISSPPTVYSSGGGGGIPHIAAIAITKAANCTTAHEGDRISYTYDVTNAGNTPLSNVSVIDDKVSVVTYQSGDSDHDGKLDTKETWIFTSTYTVGTDGPISLVNTATASATDASGRTVTAKATANVTIMRPAIAITKTANCTSAHEDDQIAYTYNVTNPGNTPLSNVSVVDNKVSVVTYQSGDSDHDGKLDTKETWIFTSTYTVGTDGPISLVNTATASATDALGTTVIAHASANVTILRPAIAITKTANCTSAHEGDQIAYTYNVTNPGNTPLFNVSVSDDKARNAAYQNGDTNGDSKLDPGETWTFTAAYTVTSNNTSPLVNTATASATDALGTTVIAHATANVTILRPAIAITKTANCTSAHEGDQIAYTYNVTNPGNTPLFNVSVSDDKAGNAAYQNGDTNGDSKLDPGETWTFTAAYTVTSNDTSPLVNTATASATDALGATVIAHATANVTILRPAIAITKTANCTSAHEGDQIAYTYNVTNASNTPLSNILVSDDKAGNAAYQNGDTNGDSKLDPGETWTFTAAYTVTSNDTSPLVNTATASATDALGTTVTAHATANVTILRPKISITKTANCTAAHEGDKIAYTYNVTNPGNTPLYNVSVSDNKAGNATCKNGDTNGDSKLDPGETWTFTAAYTVTSNDTSPLVNTATASATDTLGRTVTAKATANVTILVCNINIELTWNTDDTDLDAHFIRPGGQIWSIPDDCYWENPNPDWGLPRVTKDNPLLHGDVVDGYGPEYITLEQPYETGAYQVKIEYWNDFGHGQSTATVRIWINGKEEFEDSKTMSKGDIWDCASIECPSGNIVAASNGSTSPPEVEK